MTRRTTSWMASLAALALLGACRRSDTAGQPASDAAFRPLAVGDTVPAYVARTLRGDSVRIGAGEPLTLVNVWATWCTSCREEFATLERVQRDYAPRGLRVVAVSVDLGHPERVARFAAAQGATFTVALDPEGRIQQQFQVVGVPSTYLVARDGRLLWAYTGELPDSVRSAVDRAMSAPPSGAGGE